MSFGILEMVSAEIDEEVYTFTGTYGPITITIGTSHPEFVEWTDRKIICASGLITLTYTPDETEPQQVSFEIDLEQEQLFQLIQGKAFFLISYKGNRIPFLTDPFLFFRDSIFIPARDRLKKRVYIR